MAFDPNAYLQQKQQGFDPDAYLAQKTEPQQPEQLTMMRTAKPVGPLYEFEGKQVPLSELPPDLPVEGPGGELIFSRDYTTPPPDFTLPEAAKGVGETALTIGTGATGGTAGMLYGFIEGIVDAIRSGKYSTEEGVSLIEDAALKRAQQFTYEPRTEAGQRYTRKTGEALAPMQAVAPMAQELGMISKAAKAAGPRLRQIGAQAGQRAKEAMQTIQAGKQAGVPVLTSDVLPPKTYIGKLGQAVTERIPVIGTGPVRATQQQKRIAAIRNTLSEYGAHEAANMTDDIMADLSKKRGGLISRYSDMKNSVIQRLSNRGTVNIDKTVNTIDAEISKLKSLKSADVQPAINIFEDYKNAFSGQNLQNIELLRKQLGDRFKAQDLATVKSTADKSLNKIYSAVRDDMGEFIKRTGEKRDFTKWTVGNKRLSNMMGELQNTTLKSVLAKGQATPEQVRRLLFSQKPSELMALKRNLSQTGKNKAKIAILQEVVNKAGGIDNLTPEKFLTKLNQFDKQITAFFNDPDKKVLQGLVKALNATRRASEAAVKPPTGAELTAFAAPTGLSWMLGIDPVSGFMATGGVGILARAYESAPIRNMLIKIANMKASSGPQIEAAVNKLVSMPEYKAYIAAQESTKNIQSQEIGTNR